MALEWMSVCPQRAGSWLHAGPDGGGCENEFAWIGSGSMLACMEIFENELQRHYGLLLGIQSPWRVKTVDLKLEARRVEIGLDWESGAKGQCPECGKECGVYDWSAERTWRHLDTMQFETLLRARVPRVECSEHGVKTSRVRWAEPHGRFTRLFERFAIDVLVASRSVTQGAELLGLSWDEVHHILERAVRRGLSRRKLQEIEHVGMDEKSFGRGHSYISLLTDLDGSRVLEVALDRTRDAADALWQTLSADQRKQIQAVALDMWEPYMDSARGQAPNAALVHDKFHISKHLNEAVDQVRRKEHKQLLQEGDETLKGTRQMWLFNPANLSAEQRTDFSQLLQLNLKAGRAWAAKEMFTGFWQYRSEGWARRFFGKWYGWVSRSRLKPMIKVAKMLKRHLENILSYIRHRITNAVTEGLNSKIQMIKSNARGFRNFENYRIRILFFCGKLDLYPQ